MSHAHPSAPADLKDLRSAADCAARAIPPAWPLASSVAVNPFLGQAGEDLATAGARLARVAGVAVTMPRRWYQERISTGAISDEDLLRAWAQAPVHLRPADLATLKAVAASDTPTHTALPTIADLAAEAYCSCRGSSRRRRQCCGPAARRVIVEERASQKGSHQFP